MFKSSPYDITHQFKGDLTKLYSHTDPAARPILEKVSKYTKQAEIMNMPYWVFAEDTRPIGIIALGKEPVQLLAPIGTPLAMMHLVDPSQPEDKVKTFVKEALDLASKSNVAYASAVLPSSEEKAIALFESMGFREIDDAYVIVCNLTEKEFEPREKLRFQQIHRQGMLEFIKLAETFLQASPDVTLTIALRHLHELPKEFLDFYYAMEKFYLVKKNDEIIGIVNFNPRTGQISNIGVDKRQRGKGYGRKIMLFVLNQLKKAGCQRARLRVHVKNKPAIHLYKSLGFVEASRYKTLIFYFSDSLKIDHERVLKARK